MGHKLSFASAPEAHGALSFGGVGLLALPRLRDDAGRCVARLLRVEIGAYEDELGPVAPPRSVHIGRSNVAEDQRVVILTGLVTNKPRIGAARRIELVLSRIGDPG